LISVDRFGVGRAIFFEFFILMGSPMGVFLYLFEGNLKEKLEP
jgi:hypothetical protein